MKFDFSTSDLNFYKLSTIKAPEKTGPCHSNRVFNEENSR
jgi:hypothetical protein